MRGAYRGRAAAFEKKGDYARALADHTMAVTYYAIEVEIVGELQSSDQDKLLTEAADAYLAQANAWMRSASARRPIAIASAPRTCRPARSSAPTRSAAVAADHVRIINAWSGQVSVEIDGSTHRIDPGTRKDIPLEAESVTCPLRTGPYLQTTTLRAGKTYTIR